MPEKISGLQIIGFYENSQLAERGLQEGDWILEYQGERVISEEQLLELEKKYQHTSNIVIKVRRGEKHAFFQILPGEMGIYVAEREADHEILSDAKRIEGIERLESKSGMENTFFGALDTLLRSLSVDIDQIVLEGLSAYPFRVQFHIPPLLEHLDPTVGFECSKFLFENLGWTVTHYKKKDSASNRHKSIIESIDRGIPVLAYNLFGKNDWGIITGYQRQKKEFFCRSYQDKTFDYEIVTQIPESVIIVTGKPNIDAVQQLAEPLKKSVETGYKILSTDRFGDIYAGNLAINKWIDWLSDQEHFEKLSDEQFQIECNINLILFSHYQKEFSTAAQYLERLLDAFPDSAEHLKRLIKFYNAESKILLDSQKLIPRDLMEAREHWTQNIRKNEVSALVKIYKKNKEILAVMEKLPLLEN
jgi:hypothetical protein